MPGTGRMVIDASRTFRCAHTYVAVTVARRPMFVCATCGYRTELLPLRKPGDLCGPGTLINIGRIGSSDAGDTMPMTGGL